MPRLLLTLIGAGLLLAPPAATAADPFTIDLQDQVRVAGPYVTLLEVCKLTRASAADRTRLGRVYLGRVPGSFARDYIRFRLRQAGLQPTAYRFSGAKMVAVTPGETAEPTPEVREPSGRPSGGAWNAAAARKALLDAARGALRAKGAAVDRLTLGHENLEQEARRAALRQTMRLQVGSDVKVSVPGAYRVPVLLTDAKGRSYQAVLRGTISRSRQVLVAAHSLAPGTRLTPRDVQLRAVTSSETGQRMFDRPEMVVGYEVTRFIDKGQPLTLRELKSTRLVNRGEVVDVMLVGTGFMLRLKAEALGTGTLGDKVTVRNPTSKREFAAEVTGLRQVLVRVGAAARKKAKEER